MKSIDLRIIDRKNISEFDLLSYPASCFVASGVSVLHIKQLAVLLYRSKNQAQMSGNKFRAVAHRTAARQDSCSQKCVEINMLMRYLKIFFRNNNSICTKPENKKVSIQKWVWFVGVVVVLELSIICIGYTHIHPPSFTIKGSFHSRATILASNCLDPPGTCLILSKF